MTDVAFGNLAHDSARAFRPILNAMANPGKIYSFNPPVQAPVELGPEAAAVALALCDFQSPIWLESSLRIAEIQQYIRFHTGAPITNSKPDAMFAFIDAARAVPDLADFPMGTQELPGSFGDAGYKSRASHEQFRCDVKGPRHSINARFRCGSGVVHVLEQHDRFPDRFSAWHGHHIRWQSSGCGSATIHANFN